MKELSLVITVVNEENNIAPLTERIREALKDFTYEVIWVDDGSTDQTAEVIRNLSDENTKLISLTKNFGQTAALSAGIDQAEGEYIVTLDGDLQNNPDDIPMMVAHLKNEGWDVVMGFRKDRKDKFLLRKVPSLIANMVIRTMTGVSIRDYGCSLKVFKCAYAKSMGLYGELHRFIPILVTLEGAKVTDVEVSHFPRIHGVSKYGLGRTFKVLSDLLLMLFFQKYFKRPIHFFGTFGIIPLMGGTIIGLYILTMKLLSRPVEGNSMLIVCVGLILAGIQLLTFGLLAEVMARIYFESRKKKIYTIKEIFSGQRPSEQIMKILP